MTDNNLVGNLHSLESLDLDRIMIMKRMELIGFFVLLLDFYTFLVCQECRIWNPAVGSSFNKRSTFRMGGRPKSKWALFGGGFWGSSPKKILKIRLQFDAFLGQKSMW